MGMTMSTVESMLFMLAHDIKHNVHIGTKADGSVVMETSYRCKFCGAYGTGKIESLEHARECECGGLLDSAQ